MPGAIFVIVQHTCINNFFQLILTHHKRVNRLIYLSDRGFIVVTDQKPDIYQYISPLVTQYLQLLNKSRLYISQYLIPLSCSYRLLIQYLNPAPPVDPYSNMIPTSNIQNIR